MCASEAQVKRPSAVAELSWSSCKVGAIFGPRFAQPVVIRSKRVTGDHPFESPPSRLVPKKPLLSTFLSFSSTSVPMELAEAA